MLHVFRNLARNDVYSHACAGAFATVSVYVTDFLVNAKPKEASCALLSSQVSQC